MHYFNEKQAYLNIKNSKNYHSFRMYFSFIYKNLDANTLLKTKK